MKGLLLAAVIVTIGAVHARAADTAGNMQAAPRLDEVRQLLTQQCGKKRYCKQMRSCKEACYYFLKCGLSRLDRDKDGIPCENVCSRPCKRRG